METHLDEAGIEAKFKFVKDGFLNYSKAQNCMRQGGITGHWHQHRAERQLRTIIKGIPEEIRTGDVKKQLEEQGFTIGTVTRMKKDKENFYDMVAVTTEHSDKGRELLKIKCWEGSYAEQSIKGNRRFPCSVTTAKVLDTCNTGARQARPVHFAQKVTLHVTAPEIEGKANKPSASDAGKITRPFLRAAPSTRHKLGCRNEQLGITKLGMQKLG